MQISIYVINNMPEPGRNLAPDACMGRTQLSPCIYNFSTRTIRASRNDMPAWYFFHAEPLISRFSLEKYITLLQQLWQTVLMWNLYPIFISLNQLAVKITPAESFLWMHLHQFQYLCVSCLHQGSVLLVSFAYKCKFSAIVPCLIWLLLWKLAVFSWHGQKLSEWNCSHLCFNLILITDAESYGILLQPISPHTKLRKNNLLEQSNTQ